MSGQNADDLLMSGIMDTVKFISQEDMMAIPAIEVSDRSVLPENPMVSVLLLTYNHEAFVSESIEGVVSQQADFKIELIICEDCSSDRTREICLDYQRRYPHLIRLMISEENIGPIKNQLRGECRAYGKYIALCEGDDYWTDPGKLAKQVAILEGSPEAMLCGAFTRVMGSGRLSADKKVLKPAVIKERYGMEDAIHNFLFHTSTMVIRKSALRYPRRFLELHATDRCTLILCASQGDLKCLQEIVSVYRQHPGGIWTGSSQRKGLESDLASNQFIAEVVGGHEAALAKRRVARNIVYLYHFLMDKGLCGEARAVLADMDWRQLINSPGIALKLAIRIGIPPLYILSKRMRDIVANGLRSG